MGELLSLCITERLLYLAELVVKLHLIVQDLLLYLGTLLRLKPCHLKLFFQLFQLQVFYLAVVVFLSSDFALQIILFGLRAPGFIFCSNGIEVFLHLLPGFNLCLVCSLACIL